MTMVMGLWLACAPASGVQVIDRLIRGNARLWSHVGSTRKGDEVFPVELESVCDDVAATAATTMACPCPRTLVSDRIRLMVRWRSRLDVLLLAPGIAQRTDAWYEARTQITTASDVASAIGGRNGSHKDFLIKKAGDPQEQRPFSCTAAPLKWGVMFEPIACRIYSERMGVCVHEFGLLRHPSIDHIGASPDGITETGVMLEIKCPYSRIIDGTVPSAYVAQIQCQLDVCQLDECDFFECQFELTDRPPGAGFESGILLEVWDDVKKAFAYHYAPGSGVDRDAVWLAETEAQLTEKGFAPILRRWTLKGLDIVRVHRDDAYIESMNAGVARSWQRILRYRTDRQAYRSEVLGVGVASLVDHGREPDGLVKGYAFVDDDDRP